MSDEGAVKRNRNENVVGGRRAKSSLRWSQINIFSRMARAITQVLEYSVALLHYCPAGLLCCCADALLYYVRYMHCCTAAMLRCCAAGHSVPLRILSIFACAFNLICCNFLSFAAVTS